MLEEHRLLKLLDVAATLERPRQTVKEWINDFQAFIPREKHGRNYFYLADAVQVLRRISELLDEGFPKVEIFEKLKREGYPVNVEDAAAKKETLEAIDRPHDLITKVAQEMKLRIDRCEENIRDLMIATSEMSPLIERQEQIIFSQAQKRIDELEQRQQERIDELSRQVQEIVGRKTDELAAMEREVQKLTAELERAKKPFWKKWFG